MKEIIIRKVEENDIPSTVDIQIKGWQTAYRGIIAEKFLNSMDRVERIERWLNNYKENSFIVAELNDKIIGFCRYRYIDNEIISYNIENIDCELSALYIEPNLKYMGIGTKLFKYVINEFKIKNKKKMILWCLKDNEPAKIFYRKMGGKIIKEKLIKIGEKEYKEVCFVYDIN